MDCVNIRQSADLEKNRYLCCLKGGVCYGVIERVSLQ